MLSAFLDKASGLLNRRFLVAYWFPTLFAALLLLLPRVLVHGPITAWRWWARLAAPQDYAGEGSLQVSLVIGGLLLITLIAYLLQAFTRPLVRIYEGYTWPFPLRRWATRGVARRWEKFKRERAEAARQNDMARYTHRQEQLYHEYPDRVDLLLPTRLGNVLRAAERYGGRVYGMDAPFWWPRLWPLLPEALQQAVDDGLTTIVSLLNLSALMIYVSVDVAVYLSSRHIPHRAWWAAGAMALGGLLCFAAYQGAVAQARSYGQQIRTAIDLHRFELLKALHLPLPATPQEERVLWARLGAWLYNNDLGATRSLVYDLGKPHQAAKEEMGKAEEAEATHEEIVRTLWRRLWGK